MIKGKEWNIDTGPRLLLPVFAGASATSLSRNMRSHVSGLLEAQAHVEVR